MKNWHYTVLIVALTTCVEPYEPKEISGNPDFLVVDGFLDATHQSAQVNLSRTVGLLDQEEPAAETHAQVLIESTQGQTVQLDEVQPGVYRTTALAINPENQYKLRILTMNNKVYQSNFIRITKTPEIDSISLVPKADVLDINVNTHDEDSDGTGFYRWDYVETWEFTSRYHSDVRISNGMVVERTAEESLYRCWKSTPLTRILIGTTNKLLVNQVSNYTLLSIPSDSYKLTVKYHIRVRQRTLTREAYNYWLMLQRTTEELGGLFDPMPSELRGNIVSLNNPNEPVIGLFSGSFTTEKSIYITPSDLPKNFLRYKYPVCMFDTVLVATIPQQPESKLLISRIYRGLELVGYLTTDTYCIDCRALGGSGSTLTKPDFWQ